MKLNKTKLIIALPVIIALIAVTVLIVQAVTPRPRIITGMVETTQIDISPKIPGRVERLLVHEGSRVRKGELLVCLESKEIDAKVEQARGVMEAARAKMQMARNGARPEEKRAVESLYNQARHQFELAQKTWNRVQEVYRDSVVSTQEYDQVEFKYKAAREQLEAARAKYDMVRHGARQEQIRAAEALFHQAENAYKEALAYQQETRLTSPIDGEVSKKIAEPGELVAAGYPVLTLINPADAWVVLNLREDQLRGIRMGSKLRARIPALDDQWHRFTVTYIAPMADFATWRATNQKGDFDLKTFEIHLTPAEKIEGLRPGMSVRVIMPR